MLVFLICCISYMLYFLYVIFLYVVFLICIITVETDLTIVILEETVILLSQRYIRTLESK